MYRDDFETGDIEKRNVSFYNCFNAQVLRFFGLDCGRHLVCDNPSQFHELIRNFEVFLFINNGITTGSTRDLLSQRVRRYFWDRYGQE
jgi:hypothetical protein